MLATLHVGFFLELCQGGRVLVGEDADFSF